MLNTLFSISCRYETNMLFHDPLRQWLYAHIMCVHKWLLLLDFDTRTHAHQPVGSPWKTNFMIYLLLLRFDDVHYSMIHSPARCSVMCVILCHDDVFIVKYDDERIMGHCLFAIVSPSHSLLVLKMCMSRCFSVESNWKGFSWLN